MSTETQEQVVQPTISKAVPLEQQKLYSPDAVRTADQAILLHQFFSLTPSVRYIFKNGDIAEFVHGKYYTDDSERIAELQEEIRRRHPVIYVKTGEETIMSDELDPMNKIRKQVRLELMMELLAATDPNRDMGNYVQGKLKTANTSDIASVAAGGDATQLHARLQQMIAAQTPQQVAKDVDPNSQQGVDVGKVAPGLSARLNNIKIGK